tara:strand:+ start:44 stop:520 length:477 start_codon:yes stop_codon:yes gene_type:complete
MRNLAVVLAMFTTGMVAAQFTTMKDSERFEFMSEYTAHAKDENSSEDGVKSKTPTGYVLECNGTKTGVLEHDQIVLVINEMIDFLEEFGKDANTPDFDESTVVLDEECSASLECIFNQLLDGKEVLSAWGINTDDGSTYMATFQFTSHVIHFSVDKIM